MRTHLKHGLLLLAAAAVVVASCSPGARHAPPSTARSQPLIRGVALGTAVYEDESVVRSELSEVAASGATWVRIDVDWSLVEPSPGRRDWRHIDQVVRVARADGLQVLGVLSYTPQWARPSGTDSHSPPTDPETFARFAGGAAAHLEPIGISTWEIWNEPNLGRFWAPRPDPDAYAALLAATTAAIHGSDPGAVVLSGGLSSATSTDTSTSDPVDFLRQLYRAGGMVGVGGVAAHPYTFPRSPSSPASAFAQLTQLHAVTVDAGGPPMQVWITEFGSPTGTAPSAVSEQDQAAILTEACTLTSRSAWMTGLFVYQLRDGGSDPNQLEQNFGLRRFDDSAKPAWDAWTRC